MEIVDGVASLPRQVDMQHPCPSKFGYERTGDIPQRIREIPVLPMGKLPAYRQLIVRFPMEKLSSPSHTYNSYKEQSRPILDKSSVSLS